MFGWSAQTFHKEIGSAQGHRTFGDRGSIFPFFSPDGQWVGFDTVLYKLNKISVEGGAVVPLADMDAFGASWGEDGNIIVE